MALMAHVTLSGGRVASALYVLNTGNSEFVAGLTYGLYALLPAILAIHIGRIVDKVGTLKVMRLSLVIMFVSLAIPSLHLSLITVFLCAAMGGLGFSGFILSAQVMVSVMKVERSSDRTGMYAWLQMGTSTSAVIGPVLVGLVVDNNGFHLAYSCLTVILLCGLLWSFVATFPKGVSTSNNRKESKLLRDVLNSPVLLRIYLLSMAVYLAWDCFAFMIPVLGVERDLSASSVGLILSFFAIGTFIVRAIQPWLSRISTEWLTLRMAFMLSAFVYISLLFTESVGFLCLLSMLFGISAGVGHPNIISLVLVNVNPDKAGEATGLRLMTGNFAGMTGAMVCGTVTAFAGVVPVFLGVATIMIISGAFSFNKKAAT